MPRPVWSIILLVVISVIFFVQQFVPYEKFEFVPAAASANPWTFVTAIFLHASPTHLFYNMLALFFLGPSLESRIGSRRFLILFFLAGIFGSLGYMLTAGDSTIPALGASGAIFGIIGALAVIAPLSVVYVTLYPMPMILFAVLYGALAVLGLFGPETGIANGAHVGGLIFGVFYGFYLRRKIFPQPIKLTARKV